MTLQAHVDCIRHSPFNNYFTLLILVHAHQFLVYQCDHYYCHYAIAIQLASYPIISAS